MARKPISASTRWAVFSRDNFRCRYCGAQAGQDGVALVVDHVLSVADGGDNRMDNLLSACQRCNGGKGARSLSAVPVPREIVKAAEKRQKTAAALAASLRSSAENEKDLERAIADVKNKAYGRPNAKFMSGEIATAKRLVAEFGPEKLAEWYNVAADRYVPEYRAIQYLCGCARNARANTGGTT